MTLTVTQAAPDTTREANFWVRCVSCTLLFPGTPGQIRCPDCTDHSPVVGDELHTALVQIAGSHAGGTAGAVHAYRKLANHYNEAANRWADPGCADLAAAFRRAADALARWSR